MVNAKLGGRLEVLFFLHASPRVPRLKVEFPCTPPSRLLHTGCLQSSMEHDTSLSVATKAVGVAALGYYTFIWSLCIIGWHQARSLFGHNIKSKTTLPLQHASAPLSGYSPEDGGPSTSRAGVSILRPLSGLDHNLAKNLASAFEQRYPHHLYEVLLSVRDEFDQALPIARDVCSRYPHIRSHIIVGDEACGVNPKIANLVRPYSAASFDIIWVLDSQVHMSPNALARAVNSLHSPARQPLPKFLRRKPHGSRVGLAHHVPLGVSPHSTSLGSHIEAIFLGTNHAKMYLAINSLSVDSCVMGKSNLYRKSDLHCVSDTFFNVGEGGTRGEEGAIGSVAFSHASVTDQSTQVSRGSARALARFGIFLAEDNMLALSLWRPPLQLAHVLVDKDVAQTSVGDVKSLMDYWKRRVRWIRVRRHMVPAATFIEPFTESIVCGLVALAALLTCWLPFLGFHLTSSGRLVTSIIFLSTHLTIWHLVDFAVLSNLQNAGSHSNDGTPLLVDFENASQTRKFRFAWMCRELLALPIWVAAMCGNKVDWRGRRYRILSDGRAAHVELRRPAHASRGRYEQLPSL